MQLFKANFIEVSLLQEMNSLNCLLSTQEPPP